MPNQEKRSEKRVSHCAPVTARIESSPDRPGLEGADFSCTTMDITESGVRLQTDRLLPVGTVLEMEITLMEQKFRLPGCVVWSEPAAGRAAAQAGVRFSDAFADRLWPWKFQVARVFRSGIT